MAPSPGLGSVLCLNNHSAEPKCLERAVAQKFYSAKCCATWYDISRVRKHVRRAAKGRASAIRAELFGAKTGGVSSDG